MGHLLDLGQRDYVQVWMLQHKLVEMRATNTVPDTLILVEHPHVFTVGKAVQGEPPSQINGVPAYVIERGGQWTYHGPGQILGYPILDLDSRNRDIHKFLRGIENTLVEAVARFGIQAEARQGQGQTGIWLGKKKLASIGAAIRNWVTFHGFALNVNTDLSYFQMIEPCGMPASTMTSMQAELGGRVDIDKVKQEIRRAFERNFALELAAKPQLVEVEQAAGIKSSAPLK